MIALTIGVAVAVLLIVLLILRRKGADNHEHGPIALDFAANLALAVYLLVLAYAAVLCRDAITAASTDATAEAETLTELYWTVAPIPGSGEIRNQIKTYTSQSITLDWPLMPEDKLSPVPDTTLEGLRASLLRLSPKQEDMRDLHKDALSLASQVSHARTIRAEDAGTHLESIFVVAMLLSGMFVIALPWFNGAKPSGASVVGDVVRMTVVLFGIVFIQMISHPYSGASAVEPTAFESAQQQYNRIDAQFPVVTTANN
ncbi:bestrophin-like domain [Sinosporangium siamense]|uniref:DUF4239 domain-containing protein n=1 Tax=Sinosporangium siamense TaxID=1367973 RepID=A0A919RLV0_9ACTN|nr:DUF4239 domain-containing protein [Sinosporangium siamense]GII95577.1 hypothetical protein Ssi02_58080 [Sinosporangium siamense]